MAEANRNFIEFIECLNARGVEFLVVGAHALAFHGSPRFTGDLDVWLRVSNENLERTLLALADFGLQLDVQQGAQWLVPGEIFQIGVEPNRIDILTDLSGLAFDEAWAERIPARFHDHPIYFLSRRLFLRNKRASGRAKDLADVAELEERP